MTGYFSLILHAHLPFVRHPEYPEFLEEDWLFEAITEVYLPLIFIFQSLHESGVKPRLAMNVSPPLCEMLADEMLQDRYTRHLENLLELADKEVHFDRIIVRAPQPVGQRLSRHAFLIGYGAEGRGVRVGRRAVEPGFMAAAASRLGDELAP